MQLKTKNWNAYENRQPPVDPERTLFYVIGEVEMSNGSLQPRLTKAVPQGTSPHVLRLTLTIESTGGVGTMDVAYRGVRYDELVVQGEYTEVAILYDGDVIKTMPVQIVQ